LVSVFNLISIRHNTETPSFSVVGSDCRFDDRIRSDSIILRKIPIGFPSDLIRSDYRIDGPGFEKLYVRILSMTENDSSRVYHLMKHARHSCFGLVQVTNSDEQLMILFKFLNTFLPSVFEKEIYHSTLFQ
jgi:hypothetical protein